MSRVKNNFNVDDIVAVFGGSIGREEKTADCITICKILVCGQKDLIVEEIKNSKFINNKICFKVSKQICTKLFLDPEKLEKSKILSPKLVI